MKRGVLLALVGVFFVLSSGVASAVEYGGLGGQPANPDKDNPRSKSIFIFNLAGGSSKTDAVRVVNNGNEVKVVEIYATDSELASGGSFACTQKSDNQTKVGTWIEFEKSEISLEPATNQIVNFTLTVPSGTDVGEHNGCVVIQEKSKSPDAVGNGVQLNFRSALRTVVTVPGKIVKDAEFTSLNVNHKTNKYTLTAELVNKGNVSLDTDVQIAVKDLFGREVYKNGGTYPLLAQKNTTILNFEFKQPFWGGIYKSSGRASYNGDIKASLGSVAAKNVSKSSPTRWFVAAPQPVALILYLIVILAAALLIKRIFYRSKRHKAVKSSWVTYRVKNSDTIFKLAKSRHTNWKTIARINKLKPPYELKSGSEILLPKLPTKQK